MIQQSLLLPIKLSKCKFYFINSRANRRYPTIFASIYATKLSYLLRCCPNFFATLSSSFFPPSEPSIQSSIAILPRLTALPVSQPFYLVNLITAWQREAGALMSVGFASRSSPPMTLSPVICRHWPGLKCAGESVWAPRRQQRWLSRNSAANAGGDSVWSWKIGVIRLSILGRCSGVGTCVAWQRPCPAAFKRVCWRPRV